MSAILCSLEGRGPSTSDQKDVSSGPMYTATLRRSAFYYLLAFVNSVDSEASYGKDQEMLPDGLDQVVWQASADGIKARSLLHATGLQQS